MKIKPMEIELVHFRCYQKRSFSIPYGVNLIDGPSGKGKSTLLQAIKYALFGTVKQVCSYGEKKTMVSLSYDELHITRTNIPSRLVVRIKNTTYEDDAAQQVIYKRFGNQFDITSYMIQKGSNQFFTLSGSEKLILLEELALHGEDSIHTTKASIQHELKSIRDKLKETQSQLLLLEKYTFHPPLLKKKVSIRSISDVRQLIVFTIQLESFWKQSIESNQERLSFYSNELKKQQVELSKQDNIRTEINRLEKERTQIHHQMCSLQLLLSQSNELMLLQQIDLHTKAMKYNEMTDHVYKVKESYRILYQAESLSYQKEIESLEKQIVPCDEDVQLLEKIKSQAEEQYQQHQCYIRYQNVLNEKQEQELSYQQALDKEKCRIEIEKTNLESQLFPSLTIDKEKRNELTKLHTISKRKMEIQVEMEDSKYKDISQKLDVTRQKIDKVTKKLTEIEQRKFILSCPGCKKSLLYKSQSLCSAEHHPITDVERKTETDYKEILPKLQKQEEIQQRLLIHYESLESEYQSLHSSFSHDEIMVQIEECTRLMEDAQRIQTRNEMIHSQLKQLSSTSIESKFIIMKESISRIQNQLETMSKGKEFPDVTLDSIQSHSKRLEQIKQIHESNRITMNQLEIKKKNTPDMKLISMKKELDSIIHEWEQMPQGEIHSLIDTLIEQVKEIDQHKRELQRAEQKFHEINLDYEKKVIERQPVDETDYMVLIHQTMEANQQMNRSYELVVSKKNEYQVYEHELKAYLDYKKKKEDIQEKNKLCMHYQIRMEQLEKLANHIIQAEGVCLEKFIQRVNHTMRWYLEQFFPDQSVTMELDSEKECKNGKVRHEICVKVMHQHHPCDLKALSGGEYDRCALAFMLAINELSHSPCLFLDESISSLDMSLSEDVLEVIKEKQSELNKIVLLVSHQANTGFFDHVIRI